MPPKAKQRGPSATPKAKAVGSTTRGSPSTAKPSAPKPVTSPISPTRAAASLVLAGPKARATAVPAKGKAPSKATVAEDAKKKAEEVEAKAAADMAVAAAAEEERQKQQAAAEAEIKRLAALANGEVTIKYSMYAEKFQIENHTLTAQVIGDHFCLFDVMPGCFIHLADKEFGYGEEQQYVKEDPSGTFRGLMAGTTYWCYVQQDPEQEQRDQEALRKQWAGVVVGGGLGDRGSETEGCSCGYGAPCTDPMICKDFENRFANALKAGGNPILFK